MDATGLGSLLGMLGIRQLTLVYVEIFMFGIPKVLGPRQFSEQCLRTSLGQNIGATLCGQICGTKVGATFLGQKRDYKFGVNVGFNSLGLLDPNPPAVLERFISSS